MYLRERAQTKHAHACSPNRMNESLNRSWCPDTPTRRTMQHMPISVNSPVVSVSAIYRNNWRVITYLLLLAVIICAFIVTIIIWTFQVLAYVIMPVCVKGNYIVYIHLTEKSCCINHL